MSNSNEIQISNFNEYQELASRTNSTATADSRTQMLHTYLGFTGELAEAQTKFNSYKELPEYQQLDKEYQTTLEVILSEMGDLLWYCATGHEAILNVAKENEFFLPEWAKEFHTVVTGNTQVEYPTVANVFDFFKIVEQVDLPSFCVSADNVKKYAIYKQNCKESWFVQWLFDLAYAVKLIGLFIDLYNKETRSNFTLYTLAAANIAKLKARFGDKFTVEASAERDYSAESEAAGIKVE